MTIVYVIFFNDDSFNDNEKEIIKVLSVTVKHLQKYDDGLIAFFNDGDKRLNEKEVE